MFPPLYTLFRISPLFSRDILEMAQCIMHTRWGTSTTPRLMPRQRTRVFFVRTVRVLVLHTKLSGLTGMGIKQGNWAVVRVPPRSHNLHTMLVPQQVGGLLIRHILHTGFLRLVRQWARFNPMLGFHISMHPHARTGMFQPRMRYNTPGRDSPAGMPHRCLPRRFWNPRTCTTSFALVWGHLWRLSPGCAVFFP